MALKFILIKDSIKYDMTDIVEKVEWSGRKNTPARSLKLTCLDDPDMGDNSRAMIDVYKGHFIIFFEDGNELFRGIIMTTSQKQDKKVEVTAYDNGIYLSNNKDSFSFNNKSLTEIFETVCKKYGLNRMKTATIPNNIKISGVNARNVTIYDALCQAMSCMYKKTGERYFIWSDKDVLHLIRRKEHITKLILETAVEIDGKQYGTITQYQYTRDIVNTRTRLKLLNNSGGQAALAFDESLEKILGIMQGTESFKEGNAKQQAQLSLKELKQPKETLNITALGISSIKTGMAVYISIPEVGIGRVFYVDADTHTWDGGAHTMKLTLNFATDLESINEAGATEAVTKDANAEAKQLVKDAAANLKLKKTAETQLVKAGNASEKAADKAENAVKAINNILKNIDKQIANIEKAFLGFDNLDEKKKAAARKKASNYAKSILKNEKNLTKQYGIVDSEHTKAQAQLELATNIYENGGESGYVDKKGNTYPSIVSLVNPSQTAISNNAVFAMAQAQASVRRSTKAVQDKDSLKSEIDGKFAAVQQYVI